MINIYENRKKSFPHLRQYLVTGSLSIGFTKHYDDLLDIHNPTNTVNTIKCHLEKCV